MSDKLRPLSKRERKFVEEYLIDLNKTQAAIRTGYAVGSAPQEGNRLLRKAHILAEVTARLKAESEDRIIQRAKNRRELEIIATSDISEAFDSENNLKKLSEMPEHIRKCIASIEIDELFDGHGENRQHIGYTKKIKLWNKIDAIELREKRHNIEDELVAEGSGETMQIKLKYSKPSKDESQ